MKCISEYRSHNVTKEYKILIIVIMEHCFEISLCISHINTNNIYGEPTDLGDFTCCISFNTINNLLVVYVSTAKKTETLQID